jgi:hypothetical protein
METNKQTTENTDFTQLVSKLKNQDNIYSKISRAIQIMYWIFIPVFAFITFREYFVTEKISELISGACFILAFLIFALFFGRYHKEYKYVDYSLPTIQMLKNAAFRYQPFQSRQVWILLALILVDLGLTFDWMNGTSVIEIQLTFIGVIIFSILIGLIIWYYKYKPLRDDALRLISEIEGN